MESSGCTPDRKAREMLQTALMALEQMWSCLTNPFCASTPLYTIMIAELSVSFQRAPEVNEVRLPPVRAMLMESLGNPVEDLWVLRFENHSYGCRSNHIGGLLPCVFLWTSSIVPIGDSMTSPRPSLGTPNGKLEERKASCREFYEYRGSELLECNIDYVHLTTIGKLVHNHSWGMLCRCMYYSFNSRCIVFNIKCVIFH